MQRDGELVGHQHADANLVMMSWHRANWCGLAAQSGDVAMAPVSAAGNRYLYGYGILTNPE